MKSFHRAGSLLLSDNSSEFNERSSTHSTFDEIPWSDLRILRKAGSGGAGDVFVGIWGVATPVAIKMIRSNRMLPQAGGDASLTSTARDTCTGTLTDGSMAVADFRASFLAEAMTLASISHPCCVQLFGCVSTDPTNPICIVTEYLRDGDLAAALFSSPVAMRDSRKLAILKQVASGCEHLHRKGIIHRDIKPSNVLLDEARAKIGDFGLAQILHTLPGPAEGLAGTRAYMAPEQLLRLVAASKESDVYAFGVTMWEVMTGVRAFADIDRLANVYAKLPSLAGLSLGALLEPLVRACCEDEPKKRPNFTEILTQLEAASERLVYGEPHSSVPALPKHYSPNPKEIARVRQALAPDASRSRRGVCITGMGGLGKSVCAAAIARDEGVLLLFEGTFWVSLGHAPAIVQLQLRLLGELLDENLSDLATVRLKDPHQLRDLLAEAVRARRVLIVLDDVWQGEHAAFFDVCADTDSAVLVTTRNRPLASLLGLREHEILGLDPEAALSLLARSALRGEESLPACARTIADSCNCLPLSLAMVGGLLRQRDDAGWATVAAQLSASRLQTLHTSVAATVGLAVQQLGPLRYRYLDLAVFPAETPITRAALFACWEALPEPLTAADVDVIVEAFQSKALVRPVGSEGDIVLHDLQREWLLAQMIECGRLADAQRRLREGYERQAAPLRRSELEFLEAIYCVPGEVVLNDLGQRALQCYDREVRAAPNARPTLPEIVVTVNMQCAADETSPTRAVQVELALVPGYPFTALPTIAVRSPAFDRAGQSAIIDAVRRYVAQSTFPGEVCCSRVLHWVQTNAERYFVAAPVVSVAEPADGTSDDTGAASACASGAAAAAAAAGAAGSVSAASSDAGLSVAVSGDSASSSYGPMSPGFGGSVPATPTSARSDEAIYDSPHSADPLSLDARRLVPQRDWIVFPKTLYAEVNTHIVTAARVHSVCGFAVPSSPSIICFEGQLHAVEATVAALFSAIGAKNVAQFQRKSRERCVSLRSAHSWVRFHRFQLHGFSKRKHKDDLFEVLRQRDLLGTFFEALGYQVT